MHRIKGATDDALKILDYIALAAKQWVPQEISIQPGEMLIFNNGWGINKITGVMHGRGGHIENPFRWLQRAYVKKNKPSN